MACFARPFLVDTGGNGPLNLLLYGRMSTPVPLKQEKRTAPQSTSILRVIEVKAFSCVDVTHQISWLYKSQILILKQSVSISRNRRGRKFHSLLYGN